MTDWGACEREDMIESPRASSMKMAPAVQVARVSTVVA
jgi:hypothetical protein